MIITVETANGAIFRWDYPHDEATLRADFLAGRLPRHLDDGVEEAFDGRVEPIDTLPDDLGLTAFLAGQATALYLLDGSEVHPPWASDDGGEVATMQPPTSEESRHPELEAKLHRSPRSKKTWEALAAALEPHLRARMIREVPEGLPTKFLMLDKAAVLGPFVPDAMTNMELTWKRGFIVRIRADDLGAVADHLFTHPVTRFLGALDLEHADVSALVAAMKRAAPTRLRSLKLGPAMHPSPEEQAAVLACCPDLNELQSVRWSTELPASIRRFTGDYPPHGGTGLEHLSFRRLIESPRDRAYWSQLKTLRVVGPTDSDIAPLLELPLSPDCKWLLHDGSLTDAAVAGLLRSEPPTRSIDLRGNCLTAYGAKALQGAFPRANLARQARTPRGRLSYKDLPQDDDSWRLRAVERLDALLCRLAQELGQPVPKRPDPQKSKSTWVNAVPSVADAIWRATAADDPRRVGLKGLLDVIRRVRPAYYAREDRDVRFADHACRVHGAMTSWLLYPAQPLLPTSGHKERLQQYRDMGHRQ